MTPCTRPPCPDWLANRWNDWGNEFADQLRQNPAHKFSWEQWQGQRVNQHLLPTLSRMTNGHCSYCDWFPMDTGTDPTIDHFRPKSRFPQEAYYWPNLYLSCRICQEKDDRCFTDQLLRPDEPGYSFERYFVYNHRNGTIAPNPGANREDQERAQLTITNLKLNSRGRPAARQRELNRFRDLPEQDRIRWLDDSAFRFLLIDELPPPPSPRILEPRKHCAQSRNSLRRNRPSPGSGKQVF